MRVEEHHPTFGRVVAFMVFEITACQETETIGWAYRLYNSSGTLHQGGESVDQSLLRSEGE
jgi:hypothetical protein